MTTPIPSKSTYSKTACPLSANKLVFVGMKDESNKPSDKPIDFSEPSDLAEVKSAFQSGSMPSGFKMKPWPFWVKIAVMCAVVFLASIGYFRGLHNHEDAQSSVDIQALDSSDLPPQSEKRKLAPNIKLQLPGGKNQNLYDFKGKVVLVSFWASWCTPCLVELPTFIEINDKLSSKGFVVIPVNVDDKESAQQVVPEFWTKKRFPFVTFYDFDKKAAENFNVDTLPSNFVIDKNSKIAATGYGANDWASESSIQFIEQLLSE